MQQLCEDMWTVLRTLRPYAVLCLAWASWPLWEMDLSCHGELCFLCHHQRLVSNSVNKSQVFFWPASGVRRWFLTAYVVNLNLKGCQLLIYCRKTGESDLPMPAAEAVPFTSPENLAVQVSLPRRGVVTGMGIRKGVTLIVGGGFHGKTTLLKALEAGVYNKASTHSPLLQATKSACADVGYQGSMPHHTYLVVVSIVAL